MVSVRAGNAGWNETRYIMPGIENEVANLILRLLVQRRIAHDPAVGNLGGVKDIAGVARKPRFSICYFKALCALPGAAASA